jgi:hypothetical protein
MTPNQLLVPVRVDATVRREDGYVVDIESGEVLYHEEKPDTFAVTDEKTAEWVLGKMAEADARIVGLRAERDARLDALIAQFDRREKAIEARRKWLAWRFIGELQSFAQTQLEGAKSRTFALGNGSLSFRKTPGSIKVDDKPAAIEWCKTHMPEAIKARTITDIVVTPLHTIADKLPAGVFIVTGPGDQFTIDTGIDKWSA